MAKQLLFDLPVRTAQGRDDFIVSRCNERAIAMIDAWPAWPDMAVCLVGPCASGKSHMMAIWAEKSGAVIVHGTDLREATLEPLLEVDVIAIDDAEGVEDEAALFHLYNSLKGRGGHLLLAAEQAPARWALQLPDLQSRLATAHVVEVEAADDDLLKGLLAKLFRDRQMAVPEEVLTYLVPRIERSFAAVSGLVDRLDRLSMTEQRKISIPLARDVLDGTTYE